MNRKDANMQTKEIKTVLPLKLLHGLLLLLVLSTMISMMINLGFSAFMKVLSQMQDELPETASMQETSLPADASPESTPEAGDVGELTPEMQAAISTEMKDVLAEAESSSLLPAGMYLSLALLFLLTAILTRHKWRNNLFRYGIGAFLFLVCALIFLLEGYQGALLPVTILHALALLADHIFAIVMDRRTRITLFRVGFILLLLISACLLFYDRTIALFVLLGLTLVRIFYYIGRISFSQIKMDVLRKILKKTYALEILLGLLMLIIAFSIVLPQFEFGIPTFWDALWYCFAIVTTIGFGDFSAVTIPGRIISVILGVYGIVVVALITSIIVNFYSETKNTADDRDE